MRVLSVVHEPSSTGGGGLFERVVAERGDTLDRWVVASGDDSPGSAREWGAIMVFGGVMHPDQDAEHPWLAGEIGFLQDALEHDVPMIGVCLGAQLIVRAAGGWTGPAEAAEVGWVEVDLNVNGMADPVLGVLPRRIDAFQWHYYTFGLPDGAVELASSDVARQAFRLGDRVWGIQFHAEVERHMLASWFDHGRDELGMPVDEMWEQTERHLHTWNGQGTALCNAFLAEAHALAG
jgi:GMP synthase-like glutamine amidotransferase